jgi:uncharacterized membrane protein
MFFNATEKERLNFINAPTQTIEQFEEFLPWAIAFDLEKKWTRQFESIFAKLEQKNIKYVPHWYVGQNFNIYQINNLTSQINSTFYNAATISSSTYHPGSTSGFGGKGSSGGGGGGGGGGGW